MPQSPGTPQRRRSSGVSQISTSGAKRKTHSRQSSMQSIRSPTTLRPNSALERNGDFGLASDLNENTDPGNGLGSLADELAEEEWDEDAEMEEAHNGRPVKEEESLNGDTPIQYGYEHDMGMGMLSPNELQENTNNPLDPKSSVRVKTRPPHNDYDGSDYGDSDDLDDVEGVSPVLEARMAAIEGLARQKDGGLEEDGKGVITRVAEHLRDLSSQASVESHITRLSTAHTALNSNLTHQSRLVASLTHSITSPFAAPPDPEAVTTLAPLLSTLILSIPQPFAGTLSSINSLHANSADLLDTLSHLADTLHMMRQTTNTAARRLRTARETVEALNHELNEAEEARRWLEKGDWDQRLRNKDAAKVCGEVVDGFEAVCEGWRKRLVGDVKVGAA